MAFSHLVKILVRVNDKFLFFSEDLYRFVVPVSPVTPSTSVEELIRESQDDISGNGFLSPSDTGKAICALTQLVDRFVTLEAS